MLKADFHVHTHYSPCSNMKPAEIVRTAVKKGYDVIGIVDHNNIKGGIETKKIADRKIMIIPGEEIMTYNGEVIVFLSDGKYNRNLIEVCERAREQGHFLFLPHPFDILRRIIIGNKIAMIKPDAIEVFNSRVLISKFNKMAEDYAKKNKIPRIVGSDAHFVEEIGNVSAFLDCNKNLDSVFEFISKNKMRFRGVRSPIKYHLRSNFL